MRSFITIVAQVPPERKHEHGGTRDTHIYVAKGTPVQTAKPKTLAIYLRCFLGQKPCDSPLRGPLRAPACTWRVWQERREGATRKQAPRLARRGRAEGGGPIGKPRMSGPGERACLIKKTKNCNNSAVPYAVPRRVHQHTSSSRHYAPAQQFQRIL